MIAVYYSKGLLWRTAFFYFSIFLYDRIRDFGGAETKNRLVYRKDTVYEIPILQAAG